MSAPGAPPRGVIHDLGYRPFTGRRQSVGAVARSLFLTSLQHCFGVGRSGRSKIVPWAVAAIMLIPALVISGIIIQLSRMPLDSQQELFAPLRTYFGFPYWTQLLITVFVAAQAPVLFARDLRYRTIVLYLARPISSTMLVLVRLAALTTAVFAIIAVPMTLWYAVAMSSNLPKDVHTRNYATAMVGALILALMLAALAAMVSALTTRTGLSVTGVIVALMLTSGIVTTVLGIAQENQTPALAKAAAAASPFTAVAALINGLFGQPSPVALIPPIDTVGWRLFFLIVCLAWIVLPTIVLLARTRRKASL